MEYSFEKLKVWKKSREFTKDIYILTKYFPKDEKYGLTSQIRRAAVSISSNLAEGSARKTYKDQAHFTSMAFSSLMEVLNHLYICSDLDYIDKNTFLNFRKDIEHIGNMLNSLRNVQINR